MGEYFGTDGFRGRVNERLCARHAYEIGRCLGKYIIDCKKDNRKVVIGKDPRRSSYMYEYALSAGLTASGVDGYLLHVTTTPSVSFVTRTEGFAFGVMISASHNPYTDNGIKLFDEKGEKAGDDIIAYIENHLKAVESGKELSYYATAKEVGRMVDFIAGRNRYVGHLISLSKVSFAGLKIGLDCANGSTFFIAKTTFDALGASTYPIHAEPNGENINLACGSTHVESLATFVKEQNLDMGFAFDGDGDRCICVDEKGRVCDGDHILYACADEVLTCKNPMIVTTVLTNGGLLASLLRRGIKVEQTRVGDRYVYEKMQEKNALLGGEQSGHIIFARHECTGDGIVTAIKLCERAVERRLSISELMKGLTIFPQESKNIPVYQKDEVIQRLQDEGIVQKLQDVCDGGRVIVRPSGTEEVIRILVEHSSKKRCVELAEELEKEIRRLCKKGMKK